MESNNSNNNQEATPANTPIMHSFKEKSSSISTKKVLLIFIIVIALGITTGYGLSKYTESGNNGSGFSSQSDKPSNGKIIGSDDTETFNDTTEGIVRKGGINGEGKFHLERPGGESQNVYMISSTVDLSKFIGKKIKVWGQTIDAESAGWLMDVGRIEIL